MSGGNPAAQRVQYRRCPQCQGHMQRRNFQKSSGVIIDSCRSCGTWLDADELEAIAGFLLRGGAPAAVHAPPPSAAERRASAEFVRLRAENTRTWTHSSQTDVTGIGSLVDVLLGLFR